MITKAEAFIRQNRMIDPGDTVVCGLSGGADSVCLLDVLARLREPLGFTLTAAHYNHNLRGQESDGDEAFVRQLCRDMDIPLLVGSGDVAAASGGAALEETARKMRYEFFHRALEHFGAQKLATAHNADDELETVLMRIARGTGLRGLCGIPPVRDRFIRPILFAPRGDIEAYLTDRGLSHREDSTNADVKYTRNRLRAQVLPVLRTLNPSASENTVQMCLSLREDQALLESLAAETAYDGPKPLVIRRLRQEYQAVSDQDLSSVHLEALYELLQSPDPSAKLSLPGGITACREYDSLKFVKDLAENREFSYVLAPGQVVQVGKFLIFCKISSNPPEKSNFRNTFAIKHDIIDGALYVRSRRQGDRLQLPRRPGKSLKKLFIDEKIPASQRDVLPVIADKSGVLGVYGFGPDIRGQSDTGPWVVVEIRLSS